MSLEFTGCSANLYLLVKDEGEPYEPMAELILFTVAPDYKIDGAHGIVKSTKLETSRMTISLDNLRGYIGALERYRTQLEIMNKQQRAGVDPSQPPLPGV